MPQPYPLPRVTRQTAILACDGVSVTYGPFLYDGGGDFMIFNIEDVTVELRPDGAGEFTATGDVTVAKTSGDDFGTFTVTFDTVHPATTDFRVRGTRLHERSIGITKGGQVSSVALERELSKQGVVLQELHRDLGVSTSAYGRYVRVPDGETVPPLPPAATRAGRVLLADGNGDIGVGPNADQIEAAQGYANEAKEAAAAVASVVDAITPPYQTILAAKNASIPAIQKTIVLSGYYKSADCPPIDYQRVDEEPSHAGKIRSLDRYLSSGAVDATKGGWWEILGTRVLANHFGARGDGTTDDRDAFHNAAAYLDHRGGGSLTATAGTYLIEAEWTLPCGVDFVDDLGRIVLKHTEAGGNGLFLSTDVNRLGQHSRIYGIVFGRSGSSGNKAIYSEDDNAPFFTQSPHWDIQRCAFFDLDADYTLPPSPFIGGPQYGWVDAIDLHHSNGTRIVNNDVYGHFNPYEDATGQDASTAVRLGTQGANGVIASEIAFNRFWYCHTAMDVGEDVLAFWFEKNECIKCYRGIVAPADPLGDGVVLQADTRIRDNYITVCTTAIDLRNRQVLQVVGNHTNSDANYFDNGVPFQGIRLEGATKYKLRGNSANLSAGHAAWTGPHRAVVLSGSDGGSIVDQSVSRYFHEGIYLNSTSDVRVSGADLVQLTDAGLAFAGTCRNVIVGDLNWIDAEPIERYKFYSAQTDINDITITSDEFVVPHQETVVTVSSNLISVSRKSHAVDTVSAPQTVNNATGQSVRAGVRMALRASSSANALTLVAGAGGAGQFLISGNFVSTNARDFIELVWSEVFDAWLEISRSDNG